MPYTISLNTVLEEKPQIHYQSVPFNHTICVSVYLLKVFVLIHIGVDVISFTLLYSLLFFLEFWLLILGIFSMTKVGECICCSSCFFCIGSFINLKKNTSQVKIDNSRQKKYNIIGVWH